MRRSSHANDCTSRMHCERAKTYHKAGVDAIMIHSKNKSPDEVLEFLREYRALDPHTPLVVVPTTYSATSKETLVRGGANIIIYANHLMRAKISAVSAISDKILAQNSDLFAKRRRGACVRRGAQLWMPIEETEGPELLG